jgi:hypothetical protein
MSKLHTWTHFPNSESFLNKLREEAERYIKLTQNVLSWFENQLILCDILGAQFKNKIGMGTFIDDCIANKRNDWIKIVELNIDKHQTYFLPYPLPLNRLRENESGTQSDKKK